ncbi:hypothetical protein PHYPSEUDO_005164 [Phytophthora pseudosyringae]|uniref:Uncharacterized protein n=1 Tax=Phytophthora pseudosyringae TaxID=221518 RepID=A0A8T1VPI9_9STRA|nr:hypothetical protein PHYPSEUDO_005164 [Phytophthora pseudosyringae]
MQSAQSILTSAVDLWEVAQVELHGRVSGERILRLRSFLAQTTIVKAVAICLSIPVPCVLMLAALEAIPLASPSDGTLANYAFWIRHVTTLFLLAPGILSHFQSSLPELNITRKDMVSLGFLGSIASGGFSFAVSLMIGFPVPFTLLVSAPAWLLVVIPPTITIYITRLRHHTPLLGRFIRCWLVIGWLALSVVLYPLYIFGFHHLGPIGQVFYVGLLPFIKITGRNVICWLLGDRHDVKAEIVIFNVEVFSALYMSVALQNSAKLTTTMAVVAVDIVQSVVAIRDISKMMKGIDRICITTGRHRTSSFRHVIFNPDGPELPAKCPQQLGNTKLSSVIPSDQTSFTSTPSPLSKHTARIHPSRGPPIQALAQASAKRSKAKNSFIPTSTAISAHTSASTQRLSKKDQKILAVKSAQVLFTAEFVLLVKYVEAIVPAIYAAFVVMAFILQNQQYYNQLDSITPDNLNNTALNVMIYCLLKTLSLCIMCFVLTRKLGMSAIHLVAFVLLHQWEAIFSKLLTWSVYTTLTSLSHSGPDFTFQFSWLHEKPPNET